MQKTLERKLQALRSNIKKLDSAIVAFSGGVDSTLLMRICREELGERAVAVTSQDYASADLETARRVARVLGFNHKVYPQHGTDICKGKIYSSLKGYAARMKAKHILDGSHKDDERAGQFSFVAAQSAGVKSPLLESDLSKAEIRLLAKEMGLPNWELPASGNRNKNRVKTARTQGHLEALEKAKRYFSKFRIGKAAFLMSGKTLIIQTDRAIKLDSRKKQITNKLRSLGFSSFVIAKN